MSILSSDASVLRASTDRMMRSQSFKETFRPLSLKFKVEEV